MSDSRKLSLFCTYTLGLFALHTYALKRNILNASLDL